MKHPENGKDHIIRKEDDTDAAMRHKFFPITGQVLEMPVYGEKVVYFEGSSKEGEELNDQSRILWITHNDRIVGEDII